MVRLQILFANKANWLTIWARKPAAEPKENLVYMAEALAALPKEGERKKMRAMAFPSDAKGPARLRFMVEPEVKADLEKHGAPFVERLKDVDLLAFRNLPIVTLAEVQNA